MIWGPNRTMERADRIVWEFSGVRENGELARWKLTFFFDSRKFKTRAILARSSKEDRLQQSLNLIPEMRRAQTQDGPVTEMLRAQLPPESIARATFLAINYRR